MFSFYKRALLAICLPIMFSIACMTECYAGDREFVYCESVPYYPNTVCYVKVHMSTITPSENSNGDICVSFFTESHTLRTDEPEKHIASLLFVQTNLSTRMSKTTTMKTVNYHTKEILYPNTSFGWLEIKEPSREFRYVTENYDRYISQGTIGDTYRPFDDNLTNETVF